MSTPIHDERVINLARLAEHPHYHKLMQRLTEAEFDGVIAFLEDHADLDRDAFTLKVNSFELDQPKSKHHAEMTDLLLACREAA